MSCDTSHSNNNNNNSNHSLSSGIIALITIASIFVGICLCCCIIPCIILFGCLSFSIFSVLFLLIFVVILVMIGFVVHFSFLKVQQYRQSSFEIINSNDDDDDHNNVDMDGEVHEMNDFGHQYREIPLKDIKLLETLGSGATGTVYRGRWRSLMVAIKVVPLIFHQEEHIQEIRREMEITCRLGNHPNILPLLGAVTIEPSYIYVITKLCEKGSIYHFLLIQKSTITKEQFYSILVESAIGLAYLHSENVIHRDVAARNYLIANPFNIYLI